MHIFVINLEKDSARRESISLQLQTLGLPFELVPAVYGANLTHNERKQHYSDRKAKWYRSRSLVDAEIGCALSHINVYRQIIDKGIDKALILEDDVTLPENLQFFIDQANNIIDNSKPTVWLLSPATGVFNTQTSRTLSTTHKVLPYANGYYASSYIVNLEASKALVKELYPVSDVADCWAKLNDYHTVDLYVIDPPVITQNQDEFGSSTTADIIRKKSSIFSVLIYKLRRLRFITLNPVVSFLKR